MNYVPCAIFFPGDRVRSADGTEGVITEITGGAPPGCIGGDDPALLDGTAQVRTAAGEIIPVPLAGLMAWADDDGPAASRAATRSRNAAIVTLGFCLAAFLACALGFIAGWHPAFTGRAAGPLGAAAAGCGFWLHWAASRAALEPDDGDDMRPECPYGCDHGDQGDAS